MARSFEYGDSIIYTLRSGEADTDPYLPFVDVPLKIINNSVLLNELPVRVNKVQVKDISATPVLPYFEIPYGFPGEFEYVVDYNVGIVRFNPAAEGKTLAFTGYYRGEALFPASRIWTKEEGGNVTQVLSDIIEAGKEAIGNLEEVQEVIDEANAATEAAINAASSANATNTSIQNAEDNRVTSESTRISQEADRVSEESFRASAETGRVSAEASRASAESSRVSTESARVTAESGRVSAENTRDSNEISRQNQETIRQSQESSRVTAESTRQTNTANAINSLNTVKGSYSYMNTYNSGTSYVVNNQVQYNGTTYICILNSTGNLPTNTTYWRVFAAKGADGLGTVSNLVSTSNEILVGGTAQVPDLSVNTGTGANQIVKRNANGKIDDLVEQSGIISPIKRGQNLINTDQASLVTVGVSGRTLYNIMGKNGNCESLDGWISAGSGTVEISTTQKRSGMSSIKISNVGQTGRCTYEVNYLLDTTKQYFLAAWVYLESYGSGPLTVTLRDFGADTVRYTATVDTAKVGQWQFVYVKVPAAHTLVGSGFRVSLSGGTTATFVAYFDNIRLYEVSPVNYSAIGTTITSTSTPSIDDVWPYVDGIQHLQNPAITKIGKNMFDKSRVDMSKVTDGISWVVSASSNAGTYDASRTGVWANIGGSVSKISALPSFLAATQYTFTFGENGATKRIFYTDGTNSSATSSTFTSTESKTIQYIGFVSSTTYLLDLIQIELGPVATTVEPYNDDTLLLPCTLASDIDRSVCDQVLFREGAYRKLKRWQTGAVLDGSLAWTSNTDYSGYKLVRVLGYSSNAKTSVLPIVSRWDGKPIKNGAPSTDGPDVFSSANWSANILVLSVADVDSGWTETLNPNDNTVKALMNGWKANSNNGTVYNSWVSVLDGSVPTTNTEAYVSANKAPNWTGWATLSYQLAAPIEESIQHEGSLAAHVGGNVFGLFEGVVERERVNPVAGIAANTGTYYINIIDGTANVPSGGQLKNRAYRILNIYKEDESDTIHWSFASGQAYGDHRASIRADKYDPTKSYYVTYILFDKYLSSSNAIDATITYQSTIGSVVGQLVQATADIQAHNSVQDWALDWVEAKADNVAFDVNIHLADNIRHTTSTERSTWNAKETPSGAQTKADAAAGVVQGNLNTHIGRTDNPHVVTKSQIGLGNVDNVKQMPIAGGTFTGVAVAQNNTAYTTKQIRNVIISTSSPSGGANGDIWFKYS